MTTPIRVETHKDRLINTTPQLKVDVGNNVEIIRDPSETLKIEIPEKKKRAADTDSEASSDYSWLVNPSKLAPPRDLDTNPTEAPKPVTKVDSDAESVVIKDKEKEKTRNYDTESEKSHKSAKPDKDTKSSDYRPRYEDKKDGLPAFQFPDKKPVKSEFEIRKEKAYLLYLYETKNKGNRYSHKSFNADSSLAEIADELELINQKRGMETSLKTWKKNLLILCDGIVFLNNRFDPFEVNMDDWSVDIHYEVMEEGRFDDVLEQLIYKWQAKLPQSPELKLVLMLAMSFGFGVFQKKRAKKIEDERRAHKSQQAEMDRRMRAQEEEIAKLHYMLEQQARQAAYLQAQAQQQQQQTFPPSLRKPEPLKQQQHPPRPVPTPQPKVVIPPPQPDTPREREAQLSGPSFTAEDLKKAMQNDFTDPTVLDETTDGGEGTTGDKQHDGKQEDEGTELNITPERDTEPAQTSVTAAQAVPLKRGRGRPPKNRANAVPQGLQINI